MEVYEKELDELIKRLKDLDNSVTIIKDDDGDSPISNDSRIAFKEEFKKKIILDRFAGACSAVMYISTVTDIPLDDVLNMFVEELREELHSKDTEAMMVAGKALNDVLDILIGKEN